MVGDGGGSSKSFDLTDGVKIFSLGSSSDGASSTVVEGLPSTAGGVLASAAGGAESLMEISSMAPSLSMQKLNSPKAMSKPLVLVEAGPVELGTGPMLAIAVRSMSSLEAIVGLMPSMLTVGEAPSMMVSMMVSMTDTTGSMTVLMAVSMADGALSMAVLMAVSMADGALSMAVSTAVLVTVLMTIGALSMAVVGEGASDP
jgi:hypothetical protein